MSALGEQHQAWVEARKRLLAGSPPLPKQERKPRPRSPFDLGRRIEDAAARHPLVLIPKLRRRLFVSAIIELDDNGEPIRPHIFAAQWREIAKEVAYKHDVSVLDMQSPRRDRATVHARHEAFYRCRTETALSLPQIGRRFGDRDHTTVLHGIQMHERRMREAADLLVNETLTAQVEAGVSSNSEQHAA